MGSTLTAVIAGNLRARLAWLGIKHHDFAAKMGWSRHTCHNKLNGLSGLNAEEVGQAAKVLGLEDPGLLFAPPGGFTGEPAIPTRSIKMNWGMGTHDRPYGQQIWHHRVRVNCGRPRPASGMSNTGLSASPVSEPLRNA